MSDDYENMMPEAVEWRKQNLSDWNKLNLFEKIKYGSFEQFETNVYEIEKAEQRRQQGPLTPEKVKASVEKVISRLFLTHFD